jgi:hypothetical protein
MASTIFPAVAAAASGGSSANAFTIPTANTKYQATQSFDAGVYTVTASPSSDIATVTFFTETTSTNVVTSSGTVSLNLASAATGVYISSNAALSIFKSH